jgi:hypothetical protein
MKSFEKFIIEEKLDEGAKWASKNLDLNNFYNLWASLDVASSNLSHFMDDMNKGKTQDALFSLKVAYEELQDLLKSKTIEKQLKNIEAELRDNNAIK